MLGTHWIAEGLDCDAHRLNAETLRRALLELPAAIGSVPVSEPELHVHADGTLAGIVLIADSHIALHCFVKECMVHADVFSCKAFGAERARESLTRLFGARRWEERELQR